MALSKLPITLNFRALSLAEGLRAGVAVAVTLITGELLGLPQFGLAALGALLTCFADPGGPLARRAPAVILFVILSSVSYGLFGLIRGEGIWLAAPLAAFVFFCGSFARVYGQGGLQVGNLTSVATVLALDTPLHSVEQATFHGLNFCAGASWAALLTLGIWRIRPYGPARRAIAAASLEISRFATELSLLAQNSESLAAFETHAATHRRAVRDALEAARSIALATFRNKGLGTQRAALVSLQLETLEKTFANFIALADMLESDQAACGTIVKPVSQLGLWFAAWGRVLVAEEKLDGPELCSGVDTFNQTRAELSQANGPYRILHAIAEHMAVLITPPGRVKLTQSNFGAIQPLRRRIISPIRQNFNLNGEIMRHALRAGVISLPVLACTMAFGGPFAHWTAITMVLCLQPFFAATWVRSAERMVGTAFGGLLAAGIGLIAKTKITLAFVMLPLTAFAFSIRGVSYPAFVAALTPMIVLLVEQIGPGAHELIIALSRIFFTLLGGMIAILGNLALWPGFEENRLEQDIRKAITAHADLVNAVFNALISGGSSSDPARRAAGLASNNLEAALSRALQEPHKKRDAIIARGAIVDAALRRMAGRLSLLALDKPTVTEADKLSWVKWQNWLSSRLAGSNEPRPALPPGPSQEALTRLARQVELIST